LNGDFGMSPFHGQLSGKPLLATARASIGAEIKAQGYGASLIRAQSRGHPLETEGRRDFPTCCCAAA
jgi:hypothetical protein